MRIIGIFSQTPLGDPRSVAPADGTIGDFFHLLRHARRRAARTRTPNPDYHDRGVDGSRKRDQ